ncbi:ABC transporter substrate-binding protein [Paenibacillus cellulosilyticus]|uniref:ABC transporter substrate-binding protein n=1 Tax=Paenibacillus cellulosilyticus TaxID=375489 RepID=UPI0015807E44|nr:ABC transporter substrate-binding protein [Paenibacillus cellulosilyticus]
MSNVPNDLAAVEAEISKITKAKINATVKFAAVPIGQWTQQSNLMLTGGEKLDLMLTDFATYGGMVARKQLLPLDDLIEKYGQGIQESLGEKLESARIDGNIYATPVNQLPLGGSAIYMRKDVLDKAGIEASSITSTDDLDKLFQTIHEKNPDLTVIAPTPTGTMPMTSLIQSLGTIDTLTDGLGVLDTSNSSMQVVDLYETEAYANALKKMRSWYEAGFIPKDAVNTKVNNTDLLKSGKAFSLYDSDGPSREKISSANVGMEMVKVSLQQPLLRTQDVLGLDWAIPAKNSKNPDKALEFLNLMYTDKDILNLINFGIEGKHYTKNSDNTITRVANSGYELHQSFMFGDVSLTYLEAGEDVGTRDAAAFQTIASPALGFTPNLDAVKSEVAAVKNVTAQYVAALETGSVDPDKVLPVFIDKLKAAGMDKIVAEKQKQLDAWLASKK